jgi:predicted amidohydrolase
VITALSALASELDIWILVGSIAVRADASAAAPGEAVDKRFCNRSVLLAPRSCAVDSTRPELAEGADSGSSSSGSSAATAPSQVVASYDKIYLFDVPSLNGAETYLESARVRPGNEAVVVDCSGKSQDALGEGVIIGMSVCYGQKNKN